MNKIRIRIKEYINRYVSYLDDLINEFIFSIIFHAINFKAESKNKNLIEFNNLNDLSLCSTKNILNSCLLEIKLIGIVSTY